MPQCNHFTFQIFLDELSKINENEFKILLLDNGAFHKSKELKVPENIALLFIPPYSPELNPAEKIWWKMKRAFTGKLHKTLENVSNFIKTEVDKIQSDLIKKTCSYEYIYSYENWTVL